MVVRLKQQDDGNLDDSCSAEAENKLKDIINVLK